MKNETKKITTKWGDGKVPVVEIDPSLDKYAENTPFPEKLAFAEEILKGIKIPEVKREPSR